ncbi:beta-galactosidase [Nocardiopsis xinjiangensis]|uniref:beta-galactosidase n=1 Tax=Nocardiopsis xinjiangensis TaxID=124285 RepID=UPI0003488006|nr:beta-galactosidase [Nocardiopsis xinjiangensis]
MTHERPAHRWIRWPNDPDRPRFGYGADYNPEQWPREVWEEDLRLMEEAGVTIVSLGIFSWARIQTGPDTWDFSWLDELMDRLHESGIAVDLATATTSPPPWLVTAHPEVLPVSHSGRTVWPGSRQHWRPTSPVFREHALRLTRALAERYGRHPALAAWHVSNELGCHNLYDYSDDAAAAFRAWLRRRYGDLDTLNEAWGTAFWSQHYTDWNQILPPRAAAFIPNPTQDLDFTRFSNDALLEHLRAERDLLRRITPEIPVTTNFMVNHHTRDLDYVRWAHEVDFVANDHYVRLDETGRDELSFSANLTSGLARGRPWFLMEHSTSAVNWKPVNLAKREGQLHRDSLLHLAHGADAVCFFQWRQSRAGAEKYHSAMVPHAGPDSRVFRDVVELGRLLREDLAEVAGSERLPARAAVVFDYQSWRAVERPSLPSEEIDYHREALEWYQTFLDLGIRADIVPVDGGWDEYDLVVAPLLHMVPGHLADRVNRYADRGGHLVTTYFSGTVDADDHVYLGGHPGAFRDLLGIRVEEFSPLPEGVAVPLDTGGSGDLWTEEATVTGRDVQTLARYGDGPLRGRPALTLRRIPGGGTASYTTTRLSARARRGFLLRITDEAGVGSELPEPLRGCVELAVRTAEGAEYWFLSNRTDEGVVLADLPGTPLTGTAGAHLPPDGVAVLRVERP